MLLVLNNTQLCAVKNEVRYTRRKNMLSVKNVVGNIQNVESKLEGG